MPTPDQQATAPALEADLCTHIFTASAALVGVCLKVSGLIRVVTATTKVGTIADDLLASGTSTVVR